MSTYDGSGGGGGDPLRLCIWSPGVPESRVLPCRGSLVGGHTCVPPAVRPDKVCIRYVPIAMRRLVSADERLAYMGEEDLRPYYCVTMICPGVCSGDKRIGPENNCLSVLPLLLRRCYGDKNTNCVFWRMSRLFYHRKIAQDLLQTVFLW